VLELPFVLFERRACIAKVTRCHRAKGFVDLGGELARCVPTIGG
jgi:hypothetical protein